MIHRRVDVRNQRPGARTENEGSVSPRSLNNHPAHPHHHLRHPHLQYLQNYHPKHSHACISILSIVIVIIIFMMAFLLSSIVSLSSSPSLWSPWLSCQKKFPSFPYPDSDPEHDFPFLLFVSWNLSLIFPSPRSTTPILIRTQVRTTGRWKSQERSEKLERDRSQKLLQLLWCLHQCPILWQGIIIIIILYEKHSITASM